MAPVTNCAGNSLLLPVGQEVPLTCRISETQSASNTSENLTLIRSHLHVITSAGPPKAGRSTESENLCTKIRSKIMDALESLTALRIMEDAQLFVSDRLSPRHNSKLGSLCRSGKLGYRIWRSVGSLGVATIGRRNAGCIDSGRTIQTRIRQPPIQDRFGKIL